TSHVRGVSETNFWSEVEKSLTHILSSAQAVDKDKKTSAFSIDKTAGMVTVFGTSRQQAEIDQYFKKLKRKAYAQVLIDARIIEVQLDDQFQSGINWKALLDNKYGIAADFTPPGLAANGLFTASVNDGDFSGILNLVQTFGTTRVLSSPRLTVLNN